MPAQHRPDVEAWRQHSNSKEPYFWPYINLEDLTKPKTMFLLLHFRGRHHPGEFAHSDVEQAALAETSAIIMPAFLNEHTMYFHKKGSVDNYGQLVSWDDDKDAFENMINGVGMHPGHGLKALEIQQRLWAFLVAWSLSLLHDIESPTTTDLSHNPGPPASMADITSLQITALGASYRIPAHLDLARLEAIASAERNAREDHLWALREDPGYFAGAMRDAAAHRGEQLLDTKGHEHPTMKEPGKPLFWNRVLRYVSMDAHFGFAIFAEIVKQINGLADLLKEHSARVEPDQPLPSPVVLAFQNLRFLLDETVFQDITDLKLGLFASPPLRQFCFRYPQDPHTTIMGTGYNGAPRDHAVTRLMPFFEILFDERKLSLFSLHTLIDEIGRLLQSDGEIYALITPWVAQRLSTLAVVSECLHQLHLFKPWSRKIEDDMELRREELDKNYVESFKSWNNSTIKFDGTEVYRLADPTDGKFDYPIHRRRNKHNVALLRKAEANLDAFWAAVDQRYQSDGGRKSQLDLVAHLLSKDRAIQRTPEWLETENIRKPIQQDEYVYQPFSRLLHDRSKQITGTFDRTSSSDKAAKPKTKGIAAPNADAHPPETPLEAPEPTIISVDKRAYKVFRTIFHSPNNPDTPGEIPWTDFLHAMVAAGFSAEKLYGSAWSFTPKVSSVGVERSIQFHEPHPVSKIPFFVARQFGRRLARVYGWAGDAFRLA
ncbi:uncharacterized protein N0V89_000143 [Didymosphaeria variabile]|uniref:Uncharacterized protein n=1 Tax=Didymosphaeria variabile TaxID=1932322 RepID=A0A9W8XUL2_9PLEO|nr:uncharacterized protein N0V89_000143 [Didymosphaeria variabile]KAJ4359588.1 hypothetical protein N0V89_000143 [Didymosphaeria variabile]